MRIGELSRAVGVTADTIRFYERSGWLQPPPRRQNGYREYGPAEVEHLRLLTDLRRLDLPLEAASRLARACRVGHCTDTTAALPGIIRERRREISERIARLQDLDARLADLEDHLGGQRGSVDRPVGGPCCGAATAIIELAGGGRSAR
jgi:MerR family transcriptional regulator, copper efflux regulator